MRVEIVLVFDFAICCIVLHCVTIVRSSNASRLANRYLLPIENASLLASSAWLEVSCYITVTVLFSVIHGNHW